MLSHSLSKPQVLLMSLTAGIAVANTYYSQPILKEIAASIDITESKAAIIPVLSLAGYGTGLFFLTPLGDKINRKLLILLVQLFLMLSLTCMTVASGYRQICFLSFFTGAFSIIAQLVLPMAAGMNTVTKSKTVSFIVAGLLTGILGARILSGFVTTWLGWRYVYGISACLVAITAALVYIMLPGGGKYFEGNYFQLLHSTILQVKRFKTLRLHALLGSLLFGMFCSFWITFTLHTSKAPFNFRADTIGLFSLVGIAGVLATLLLGKFITPGNINILRTTTTASIMAGILLLPLFPFCITALIVTVVLLDAGVQATQLTNLVTIYKLDETAHSRINTIYMTICFSGGALGTLAGVVCWNAGGWRLYAGNLSPGLQQRCY